MKQYSRMGCAILLAISAAAQAEDPVSAAGNWKITDQSSPLTGARTIAAEVMSSNELSNMLGRPERASLVVRCGESGLAVYVNWVEVVNRDGENFSGNPKTIASWRIDDGKIETNFWDISSTGTAAGEFKSKNAAKLLASFLGAHTLAVRLSGRYTQDAAFDITGVETIATNAAGACGAKLRR